MDEHQVDVLEALFIGKEYSHSTGYWSSYGAIGINWCETDYFHSEYVAEFWNTLSNVAFIVAGLQGRKLAVQHKLPLRFFLLSWSLVGIGVFSGAFHATLLWVNQKLDETFENVALVYLFHTDTVSDVLPMVHSIILMIGIFTITAFLFCELHLIGIVVLTLWKLRGWVSTANFATQGKAGLKGAVRLTAGSAVLGALFWLIDRLACSFVSKLVFNPQLHAWWHVCCGIALYEGFVLAVALHKFREALEVPEFEIKQLPLPLVKQGQFGFHYPVNYKIKE